MVKMKNTLIESSLESKGCIRKNIKINDRVTLSKIEIKNDIEKTGFEDGSYRLFNFDYDNLYMDYNDIIKGIKESLKDFCGNAKKILIVGLGNKEVVCDSLGSKTVNKLLLLSDKNDFNTKNIVKGLIPNVLGVTGIESYDIIVGVVKQINPDLIICIDTLTANSYDSLFKSIQISNTAITPGSGVKNARKKISKETIGKPVLVFGIPMLISLKNLVKSFGDTKKQINEDNVWLSPKDVDFAVEEFSYIFAKSINEFFYPELESSEIEKYIKGIF